MSHNSLSIQFMSLQRNKRDTDPLTYAHEVAIHPVILDLVRDKIGQNLLRLARMPQVVLAVLVADLFESVFRGFVEIDQLQILRQTNVGDATLQLVRVLGHHVVLVAGQVLFVGLHVRSELSVRSAIAFADGLAGSHQQMIDE